MSTESKSLNELIAKLDELTAWFEKEDFEIEQAVAKFEEAAKIADEIKVKLEKLENKITVLKTKFDENS